MFDKTQYVIEKGKIERLRALRGTYNVKDVNGNLLGYVKEQRLGPNAWFEGTDETRLGEIRATDHGIEVYDAQNRLRATIKREKPQGILSVPGWRIEDPEGLQLAEVKQSSKFFAEYQILAPDGGIIAQIHRERGLRQLFRASYRIDISHQGFDPLLILSYAHVLASFYEGLKAPYR